MIFAKFITFANNLKEIRNQLKINKTK